MTMDIRKLNEELNKKYPMRLKYYSPNPLIRLIENKRVKIILGLLKPRENEVVLDVGCEEGYITNKIGNKTKVVGIDISSYSLKEAKKSLGKNPNVLLVLGDANNLPFKKGIFDKIICSEVIEHIPTPEKTLTEVKRVCRDDGSIIVSVPNDMKIVRIKNLIKRIGLRFLIKDLSDSIAPGHFNVYDETSITNLSNQFFNVTNTVKSPLSHLFDLHIVLACKNTKNPKTIKINR